LRPSTLVPLGVVTAVAADLRHASRLNAIPSESAPQAPSAVRPLAVWNAIAAAVVSRSYLPVVATLRNRWISAVSRWVAFLPTFSDWVGGLGGGVAGDSCAKDHGTAAERRTRTQRSRPTTDCGRQRPAEVGPAAGGLVVVSDAESAGMA